MKKLNNEQQKLAKDNHNLIYSFMNKNKLSFNTVEDWYGCCAEGLCKAALIYKQDKKIKFSTLAYVYMNNEMKQTLRKNSKEESYLSLDWNITEDIKLLDCIYSTGDELREIEFYEIFNKYYKKLSDRNKQIIDDYIHTECTTKEIGNKYGISQNTVSRIYNRFLNNIYSELYGRERE